jgi:glutathione S-transferase
MKSVYHANIDLGPYRQLQAWYQRIRHRPAVQRVLREDGLLAD